MELKRGVSLKGLQLIGRLGLLRTEIGWMHVVGLSTPLVVTSTTDGKHKVKSLHYKGRAFDIRTKSLVKDATKKAVLAAIRKELGEEWDVILEDLGGSNEHIHVEYDPK